MQTIKYILTFCVAFLFMYYSHAQQATGSFVLMDGGMEGQTVGQLSSTSSSSIPSNVWTRSTATGSATIKQISNVTARTGSNFLSINNTSTSGTSVVVTPSVAQGAVVGGAPYIIQFFYRANDLTTLPNTQMSMGASNASGTGVTATNFVPNSTTNNAVWLKSVTPVIAANAASAGNGFCTFRIAGTATTNSKGIDIDDWVMYAGTTEDVTPPSIAGAVTVGAATANTLLVSWASAVDVDGGGYLVVRYTSNPVAEPDPNSNGIYSVGNTIGNGTVVYSGTGTSFISTSLTANSNYYYRVYTVDKAFNYAASSVGNGSTNSTVAALAYYIDNVNGDDNNAGTFAFPWKNISKLNAMTIAAGTNIFLKCGSTFTAQRLKFFGSGTSTQPIVIDKYGSGANPLLAGNGLVGDAVVYLYNQQYIEINNLEITNSPNGPINGDFFIGQYQNGNNPLGADRRGVMVAIDNYGTANHIYLKNLNVHHIKGQLGNSSTVINGAIPKRTGGIYFTVLGLTEQTASKSRFNDIVIDSCNINYCENLGIAFDNEWNIYYPGGTEYTDWFNRRFSNVKISNSVLHHIGKNAMIIRCTDETGLIEKNICYETALGTTGNTMFTARAKGTVFQYNEGYYNRATTQTIDPGNADGSMYDPDFGSVGIIFQYSYSHDNSHGLYWGCNTKGGNNNTTGIPDAEDVGCTARYNISQNDLGDLVYFNYPSSGNEIYNNVFYIKNGISPNIIHENSSNNHKYNFYNNIIYNLSSAGSGASYAYGSGVGVQNRTINYNTFYGNHPSTEPTDANKLTTNPLFINAGIGGNGINTLDGYKLQSTSPCINTGFLLPSHASKDFWGNPVPAVIGQNPDRGVYEFQAVVPITIVEFKGKVNGLTNQLSWTTISEVNNAGFQLQHSADGNVFTDLHFIPSNFINGNSNGTSSYSFTHNSPFKGMNYYRLKQIDKDGRQNFSTIISLKNALSTIPTITVYPNPVTSNHFSLLLQNMPNASYDVSIRSMDGQQIFSSKIVYNGIDNALQITTGKQLAKGMYTLQLKNEHDIATTQLIIY